MDTSPSEAGHEDQVPPSEEGEVSVLDILLVLARNEKLIAWTVFAFTLIGVTYALLAPEQYTSEARVVRESQEGSRGAALPGGLSSGALSGLGINLGGASSGLTPQAFPDVLESREVRLAVVRDTFQFPDAQRPMTFVEYVNRPSGSLGTLLKYTIRLPWTLKGLLSSAISDSPVSTGTTSTEELSVLSEEKNNALKAIEGRVASRVDQENGIMTISVTAGGPDLAAKLTKSFVDHLTTRVREIRTEKVRERLQFVDRRFEEAERELERAEDRLAQFLERNQNPTTATLQFRRDRLQRQVSFKEQLYSELQSQLTQTRLDMQRRQPVVTVVEEAVPPMSRSAPNRTAIVILSMALGGLIGSVSSFVRSSYRKASFEGEDKEKINKIRDSLFPDRLQDRFGVLSKKEQRT